MKLKAGVLIGRFQPLHNGHLELIFKALEDYEILIIVIGSKNAKSGDERNPFSFETRTSFFSSILPKDKLIVLGLDDFHDEIKWLGALEELLVPFTTSYDLYLCGMKKDLATAHYLDSILARTRCFTDKTVTDKTVYSEIDIDATHIRELMKKDDWISIDLLVPKHVYDIIRFSSPFFF